MAKIIAESGIINPQVRFKMLNGKGDKLSNHVGSVMDIIGYMILEKIDSEGEEQLILNVYTNDGRVIGTNSRTVCETFEAMVSSFGEPTEETPIKSVIVKSTPSAKGRNFLDFDFA